jgi:SAM-dependent methyltransferase
MSHIQQLNFVRHVKTQYPQQFSQVKVLEVGSLDINGSVRQFFDDCDYLGIDIGTGPGVDLVCQGQNLSHDKETYDTIITCECFEHNPYWVETFQNMYRLAKKGSLIILTCATTGRDEHGTSRTSPHASPLTVGKGWDYYKNLTENDFDKNFNLRQMFEIYSFQTMYPPSDLYFYGIKR